jgi:hypothetical protein
MKNKYKKISKRVKRLQEEIASGKYEKRESGIFRSTRRFDWITCESEFSDVLGKYVFIITWDKDFEKKPSVFPTEKFLKLKKSYFSKKSKKCRVCLGEKK